MAKRRLFLDCDGVLADFDRGVRELLGSSAKAFIARRGRGAFWGALAKAPNFYGSLPEMPDARILFDAVKHLKPAILTGLPMGKGAAPQKVNWAAEHCPRSVCTSTAQRTASRVAPFQPQNNHP